MNGSLRRYGEVQLATLVDAPPAGGGWLHEIKFDGYRLLAFLEEAKVKLFTRNRNDWTERFPSIRDSVARLKAHSAVLDLEAVILKPSGGTSFQALQHALGDGGRSDAIIGYVFDLLYLDGKDLSDMPQLDRKEQLERLLRKSRAAKFLRYSEHVLGKGAEMLAQACARGLEGIVSKRADAPYRPGRQKNWLKAKCLARQEFIIVGFSTPKTGKRALGALYLGYLKDSEIVYAGKVGTGFTLADATAVRKKLATGEAFASYLGPDRLIPVDEQIKQVSAKAGELHGSSYAQARAIYDYVIANMTYDKSGKGWGRGDAIYACNVKKGNCTDFHSLFIAMVRSRGIPARFTIGFPLGASGAGKIPSYHCWAEFYAGGQWVPVDASEAWKQPQLRGYYLAISTPTALRSQWVATWC